MHNAMIGLDYPQFCSYIFMNWTPRNRSLRLTKIGYTIVAKLYQSWEFEISFEDFNFLNTAKGQIFLHRHLTLPFYYDLHSLNLFSSSNALEIEVAGRDLQTWYKMLG